MIDRVSKMIELARAELDFWRGHIETDPHGSERVSRYWASLNQSQDPEEIAWSAAFMTWLAIEAGMGEAFLPSASHWGYAHQSYLNRGKPGTFGALRPEEAGAIRPGDIVIAERGISVDFDELADPAFVPTHGDIVESVAPGGATLIGGNVRNAVADKMLALDEQGAIDPRAPHSPGRIFAVLRFQP